MACLISYPTGLVVLRIYDEDIRQVKRASRIEYEKFRGSRVKIKGGISPVQLEITRHNDGCRAIFNTMTGAIEVEVNPQNIRIRRGANINVGRLQMNLQGDTIYVKQTAASVIGQVVMPVSIPPLREAIQRVTCDDALDMDSLRLYLVHYNPALIQRTVDHLVQTGKMTSENGDYRWCGDVRSGRPSFRDTVREYLLANGGRDCGVPREEIMDNFEKDGVRKTKITIALNELLARREAVYRGGLYRLTNTSESPQYESGLTP